MKKGDIIQVYIEKEQYPTTGIGYVDGQKVMVGDCFAGQGIEARIYKKNSRRILANKINVIKKADYEQDAFCPHYGQCGGCCFQTLPYNKQLELKGREVLNQLKNNEIQCEKFLGAEGSINQLAYRNKMEYTFGDEELGGQMTLGMHKKDCFMSIVTVDQCKIVSEDFNLILKETLAFCCEKGYAFYHKKSHQGLLRNLIIRKGEKTGDILLNIVTSTQSEFDADAYVKHMLELQQEGIPDADSDTATDTDISISEMPDQTRLKGKIIGILHTENDSLADAVIPENTRILWGQDYFYEEILGLKFKISPFSFFQTNTLTAERLYAQILEFLGDIQGKTVFDLYSGTGTISQIAALKAGKVIGVELVGEAVKAARENARLNRLDHCEFIEGDVNEVLDSLINDQTSQLTDKTEEQTLQMKDGTDKNDKGTLKPDIIIVDPPRAGIMPKAIDKILDCGAMQIVYVSCNPVSLGKNLAVMQEAGYQVKTVKVIDQFPHTRHVETVCLLEKK